MREASPIELDERDTRPIMLPRPILVVDDVRANLVAMEIALASLNREILTASSGTEALGHLLERDVCLVLLDVQMPGLDGFETAAMIRARERSKHLPIIFVTAYDENSEDVRRAYRLGAVDFLFKPIETEILVAKASVFMTLQDQAEELAAERLRRDFETARRDYEMQMLRRQMEREQATSAALAEIDRRKDDFLAILGHELRNPLAPIRAAIELVKMRPERMTPKTIEILDRQTTQLTRLLDDMLDISRIKANKIELHPQRHDLRDIVELAVTAVRPRIDERNHELVVEVGDEPVDVRGDEVRLAQIVTNLLVNAARYTEPGGRIAVRCEASATTGIVRVTDNGIGIAPELQDRVFEMFVQERVRLDGSGGLGLGLALAKQLVELHGGTIEVASAGRNRGTRFEISFPLLARVAEAPALAEGRRERTAPLRAVVIDDNADARELLCAMLESHGHIVMSAADGPGGLALIERDRPDVALVDLGLPGLDGLSLARAVRQQHPSLRTRLVALTGYGQADDRERSKAAGFDAHLIKPTSVDDILASLHEARK
ncbi:MAG TPA: response regulator [Kofleriaceae bacterium]|jgi:signal transduction histidine kinase|nr:response regulator [Kofleriaceae bacterium]